MSRFSKTRSLTTKSYSYYSRLPHPHALSFRVWMFRMHGPQWNNTRIILTDARYPTIDAFYLVGTGGNCEEDLDILPVDVVEGFWKGDCDLRSIVDEVYILRPGCLGQRWGRYWCMWGRSEV